MRQPDPNEQWGNSMLCRKWSWQLECLLNRGGFMGQMLSASSVQTVCCLYPVWSQTDHSSTLLFVHNKPFGGPLNRSWQFLLGNCKALHFMLREHKDHHSNQAVHRTLQIVPVHRLSSRAQHQFLLQNE